MPNTVKIVSALSKVIGEKKEKVDTELIVHD